MRIIATLTREGYKSEIIEDDDGRVHFIGDLDVDADGANGQISGRAAYHPDNHSGLDDLRWAHTGDDWYGCVTVNGKPVVQGPGDPAPGFYVSATSLHLPNPDGTPRKVTDPHKYVDAETVPFMVVPPQIIRGTKGKVLGCKGRITDTRTRRSVEVVVADGGPSTKDGEASIAAAKALGIPSSARTGGQDDPVFLYEIWPGIRAVVNGVTYPLQSSGAEANGLARRALRRIVKRPK